MVEEPLPPHIELLLDVLNVPAVAAGDAFAALGAPLAEHERGPGVVGSVADLEYVGVPVKRAPRVHDGARGVLVRSVWELARAGADAGRVVRPGLQNLGAESVFRPRGKE